MSDAQPENVTVQEQNPELHQELRKAPDLASLEDFRQLQAGSQIQVTRTSPTQIKGFCGNMVVPDGGTTDVLEEVKSAWGGGSYQLKAKQVTSNGRWAYCRGAIQVDIAGYPRDAGKEWMNGIWRPIAVPAAVAPVQLAQPAAPGGGTQMEGLMAGFLTQALQGALNSDGGVSMGELPALITAISGLSGGGAARDSFSDLERTLALVSKMNESRPEPAPVAESSDMGGLGALLPMLAQKFLQPQPQPQPAAQQYQQMPQGPPIYNPYGSIPSEQAWNQMQAQHPPGQHPHPQYAAPPSQPNWTNQPRSGQAYGPPANPQQAPQQPPAHEPPPRSVQGDGFVMTASEPETYEPLTVDDIMADMAERDDAGRLQFLGELCQTLGFDQAILSQVPAQPPMPGHSLTLPE